MKMSFNPLKFKSMKELDQFYFDKIMGSTLIRKDSAVLTTTTGWLNAIYGKKVWAQLNMEANVFALLPKEPWTQSGIRFKTARGTTDGTTDQSNGTGGQNQTALGSIPGTLSPTYLQVKVHPKTIWHGFNTSELAEFSSTVDDAVDLIPQLRQDIGEFHAFQINHMLMQEVDTPSAHNIESIDRITSNDGVETTDFVSAIGDHDLWYQHGTAATSALDRSGANSWARAQCNAGANNAAGALRTMTLTLIDTVQQNIWENGGKTKVIITGYDTFMRWQQLLEAERRFMDSARIVPTYGGVQGVGAGVEAGFLVATYNGVPILQTQAATTSKLNDTLSRIYYLDTDFVTFRTAKPTRYLESRDVFALDALAIEGGYETMGELICTFFAGQGKLRSLK